LHRLPELLENSDLEVRIAGGEAISLLYELARELDEVGGQLLSDRLWDIPIINQYFVE